jgi:type I restriction enzyme S subunit
VSSWPKIKLGDACTVIAGGTPKRSEPNYWDGEIPWVKISDMLQGRITETDERITQAGLDGSTAKLLPAGTLLVSIFATIGRTAILECDAATNQAIVGLLPKKGVQFNDRFLQYSIQQKTLELVGKSRGVAQNNINGSVLKATELPLPPLEEQKRIAGILDAADILRAKRREALAKLDDLLQSTFLDLFGDPVTNPKGWEVSTLKEIIKVKSGNGLTAKNMANDGKYPVYGGNGINGYHDRFMFEEQKIVLGRVGVYCGCVHITEPFSWVTDNALYVEKILKPIETIYLATALTFANLNKLAGQAAQPLISGSRIYPVQISLPLLDLQQRFAEIVSSVEEQKAKMRKHLEQLDDLFASLQQRAFRGDL